MEQADKSAPDRLRGLRFAAPLESDFRGQYAIAAAAVAGPAVLLGALLVVIWALIELRSPAGGYGQPASWLKLAVVVPALAAALVVHVRPLSGPAAVRLAQGSAAAVTLGFVGLLLVTPAADLRGVLVALHAATLYLYLLSGQRLLSALGGALALLLVAQWAAARSGVPASEAATAGAFLMVTNVLCAVAAYRFEHAARSAFLEREVGAILSGRDAATGIPNQLALERRYQLAARHSAREGRSIAYLIGQVDGFDRHAAASGARVAANDLRRIAHAILQSVRRPLDLAARLEGARFAVLLYDVQPERLPQLMRRIRENVALLDIEHVAGHGPSVLSLTIGAALVPPDAPRDLRALAAVAELALDEARDPENHGIAVRAVASESPGEAVTTGPWPRVGGKSAS